MTLTLCQLACIVEDDVTTSQGWYVVPSVEVSPGLCHEAGMHTSAKHCISPHSYIYVYTICFCHLLAPTNWLRQIMRPVKCTSRYHRFILLLISGIEPNPGPSLQGYLCDECSDEVEDFGARAIACNSCDRWIHKSCAGMLTAEYDLLANSSAPWCCPDCGTPQHSDIVYDIPDCCSIGSSYSDLSEGEEPRTPIEPTTPRQIPALQIPVYTHWEVQMRQHPRNQTSQRLNNQRSVLEY